MWLCLWGYLTYKVNQDGYPVHICVKKLNFGTSDKQIPIIFFLLPFLSNDKLENANKNAE